MDRQVTVQLLFHLKKEDKGPKKSEQPNLSRPKFTKTSGPGAGFRYCVDLQAGMSKFIVSDVRVHGSGRLGYDGSGASAWPRLALPHWPWSKNLAAAVALYALFPDQNIYLQLPQPFRDLWKSWMKGRGGCGKGGKRNMDKVSFASRSRKRHNDQRSKQHA